MDDRLYLVKKRDGFKKEIEFFVSDKYNLNVLNQVQNRLLQMAVHIRNILEKHNIPYIITFGTLLGAVRHGGFIPWDDDFDFFLFEESYEQAISYLQKELPTDYFVHNEKNDPIYWPYWSRVRDSKSSAKSVIWSDDNYYKYNGLNVDLYKLKKCYRKDSQKNIYTENIIHYRNKYERGLISKKIYEQKTDEISRKLDLEKNKNINDDKEVFWFVIYNLNDIEIDTIFPLKRYCFEGQMFYGPNRPDILLKKAYGNYNILPEMESRKTHYAYVNLR